MEISVAPPVFFTVWNFPVTNTFLITLVLSGIFIFMAARLRRLREVPSGLQFWAEVVFETAYNFIYSLTKNHKATAMMFPLITTMFMLILFGNLLAYIPGISTITFQGKTLYRTITSDYSLVLMMTLISVGLTQIVAIWTGGLWHYVKKFINLSGVWHQKPLNFFLGIMDLISEGAKVVSLSFRLFGNMFAGEVLGMVIGSLMPFILPLPFAVLGLLTAFVQPAVFSVFTALNLSGAIVPAAQPQAKT